MTEPNDWRKTAAAHVAKVLAEQPDTTRWAPTLQWLKLALAEIERLRKYQAIEEIELIDAAEQRGYPFHV